MVAKRVPEPTEPAVGVIEEAPESEKERAKKLFSNVNADSGVWRRLEGYGWSEQVEAEGFIHLEFTSRGRSR